MTTSGSRELHPIQRVVKEWNAADPGFRASMISLWPNLAEALDALCDAEDRMITDPGSVTVPEMADPGHRPGPHTSSRATGDQSHRPAPSVTHVPGQMPLFDTTGGEK